MFACVRIMFNLFLFSPSKVLYKTFRKRLEKSIKSTNCTDKTLSLVIQTSLWYILILNLFCDFVSYLSCKAEWRLAYFGIKRNKRIVSLPIFIWGPLWWKSFWAHHTSYRYSIFIVTNMCTQTTGRKVFSLWDMTKFVLMIFEISIKARLVRWIQAHWNWEWQKNTTPNSFYESHMGDGIY